MIRLLDKEQQRKYSVLLFLESHKEAPYSMRAVCQELRLSEYLLKAAVAGLSEDLENLGIIDVIRQDQTVNTLQLVGEENHLNSYLLNHYIQHSLGVDILLEILQGSLDSVKKFSRKKYISSSVAYRWIQEITDFLADHQLILQKKDGKYEVLGEERHRHLMETELCFRAGIDPQVYGNFRNVEVARKIYLQISETCRDIPLSMERKLLFFLVIMIRDRNKVSADHEMTRVMLKNLHHISWYQQVVGILQELELSVPVIDRLTSELCAYTLYLGLLGAEDQTLLLERSQARQMTTQALALLWDKSKIQLERERFYELQTSLDWVHFAIRYQAGGGTLVQEFDWSFFKENHPELTRYCVKKIHTCQERGFEEIWCHRDSLIGHYLLLLERYGYPELEKRELCVTIDFSYGRQFNEYIQNGIEKMASPFSLKVTQQLSNETDILLTDELVVDDRQMEVIRLSMMSAQFDWQILKKRLAECVERKASQRYISVNEQADLTYSQA